MRIHQVTPHFYPDRGGVERYVLRLGRFLEGRGHEVLVHTSRRSQTGEILPPEETVDGIRVLRYPNVVRLGYYWTLFRPRIEDGDIVHLHGYGHLANDWTARRVHGARPVVYSLHHGLARIEPTRVAAIRRSLYDRAVGLGTLRRCDALVCNTDADRSWLEGRRLPTATVRVIPTGLEEAAFDPGDPGRGRALAGAPRYLLYVGRLQEEKRLDDLVRALAALPDKELSAVLAGPDVGAGAALRSLASSLSLGPRVRFMGPVTEESKRDLLAGCEAFVLPSSYESQGVVLMEAWAQGRPVIATRVGGVVHLVADGADGLLVQVGDTHQLSAAVERLVADPEYAARLGRAGQEKVRRAYRETDLFDRIEELYETLRGPRRTT